jgi:uncharacterized NAD(P)/FAD-binding protein YdhS
MGFPALSKKHIVVIGGGFSGVVFALQLKAAEIGDLAITIIEPQKELGAGLAYSSRDPEHRLNASAAIHFALPDRTDEFDLWYRRNLADQDLGADYAGDYYPQRHDFARYLSVLVEELLLGGKGAIVRHVQATATSVGDVVGGMIEVETDNGELLQADAVVLATGNRPANPPPPFSGDILHHPSLIAVPWDRERVGAVDNDDHVLILGTALTAADMIASLQGQKHRGAITAISRRGLVPHTRPPMSPPQSSEHSKDGKPSRNGPVAQTAGVLSVWHRISGDVPGFLKHARDNKSTLGLLRIVRAECRRIEAEGGTWHAAFDDLRDSVWQIWPSLELKEKRRFLRHLKSYYDIHRFRMPPQAHEAIDAAIDRGQLNIRAARFVGAAADGSRIKVVMRARRSNVEVSESFDTVINCTGTVTGFFDDPLSRNLTASGTLRPHGTGIGWDTDLDCRAIRGDDSVNERFFVVGPPTAGVFGDPLGTVFISAQISRIMPTVKRVLSDQDV